MKFIVFITVLSILTTGGRCAPQQPPGTLASTSTTNTGVCIDGHRWKQGCNDCICLNGHQVCTTNICVPHTITIPTPRPTPPRSTSSRPGSVRPSVAVSELALYEAAKVGDVGAVVAQLAAGADVNWVNRLTDVNRFGRTALYVAARYNHPDVVTVLLDAGAAINFQDDVGTTPISRASAFGSNSALGLLISRGGDVNLPRSDGFTPLHNAAVSNGPDIVQRIVQQLLEAGANTTAQWYGQTPGDLARSGTSPNLALGATIDNYSPAALGPLTAA